MPGTWIRIKALWALAGMLALVALLGACAGAEPTATPTPTPTLAAGAPTPTPTPKGSPTPTPTPRLVIIATPTPTPTPGAVQPTARTPKGSVTVASGPLSAYSHSPDRRFSVAADSFFQGIAFEWLVGVTPEHELVSMLAESWESPDGGHTWIFKLRQGVKFHNGKEMTAEDVAASFNSDMQVGTGTASAWARENLTPYEVVDKYTVRVSLKGEGRRLFVPAYIGRSSWFAQVISPKEMFDKYPDKPWPVSEAIGTGPYRLVEVVRGEKMRGVALDPKTDWAHWRVVPAFKEITLRPVKEDGTRIAMLKTGAADIIDVPTALKKEVAGFTFSRAKHGATAGLLNTEGMDSDLSKWWKVKEVRMALNLAIDRQEIADFLFNGEAEPIAAIHFSPGAEGFDPSLKPYPYDPAKARQLLKDAGYDMNFVWNVWLRGMGGVPELQALGEAIAAKWEQELGVKTKLIPTDATVSGNAATKHDPTIIGHFITFRSTNFPDISVPITTFSGDPDIKGRHELVPWHGKGTIHDNLVALGGAADPRERARLAGEIQKTLYNDYVHVQGWSVHVLYAFNPKTIKDFRTLQGSTYLNFLEYLEPPTP
ncbi:MAG: ABC transporter substrate-binding protein [Chloroflexi bacterium]|nr:ABC transporter substrate-binding protein [Chloroflexota bacterium]